MKTTIMCKTVYANRAYSLDKHCKEGTQGYLILAEIKEINLAKVEKMYIEFPVFAKEWEEEEKNVNRLWLRTPVYTNKEGKQNRIEIKCGKEKSEFAMYSKGLKPKFRYDVTVNEHTLLQFNKGIVCTPIKPLIYCVFNNEEIKPPTSSAFETYMRHWEKINEKLECTK